VFVAGVRITLTYVIRDALQDHLSSKKIAIANQVAKLRLTELFLQIRVKIRLII